MKELFVNILEGMLVPFITNVYPEEHIFMQDNNPKHTSGYAADWMKDNSINWWKTPAESPDLRTSGMSMSSKSSFAGKLS